MSRALALARKGEALASPNPMVGAVLVKGGRVVGEGFHIYDGVKHAEILALEKAGRKARGATLYINLEPCCHTGRTGPCTKALIAAGVKRVVAAMPDPNPRVSGRGFRQLRRARVNVDVGLHQEEGRKLNEAFAKWIRTGLPLVTLKAAVSSDWKIASPPGETNSHNRWITSPASREEVQRMRHAADAILTGIGTVLADDPLLTDRTGKRRRRRLLRVVLDSRLRLPLRSRLVRSAQSDVLVFTTRPLESRKAAALRRAGVELVRTVGGSRVDLRAVLEELGRLEVQSLMIEAGAEVNTSALEAGVVDRLALFISPKQLGEDAVPFVLRGRGPLGCIPAVASPTSRLFGPDLLLEGILHDVYRDR